MSYLVVLGYSAELGVGVVCTLLNMEADPPLPAWNVENISDLHF